MESLVSNNKFDPTAFILAHGKLGEIEEFVNVLLKNNNIESSCLALKHILLDPCISLLTSPVKILNEALRLFTNINNDVMSDFDNEDLISSNNLNIDKIHRVFLTPLRISVQIDIKEVSNRVIREFKEFRHRFIRVSILEENFSSISQFGSDELLANRFSLLINEGMLSFFH